MKIINLKINNFRGIKNSCIKFPSTQNLICIIGSGDSTKTTILNAIEWVLWPSWNLHISDTDFYECKTTEKIIIEISLIDLPNELLTQDKYGLYLRSRPSLPTEDDEPINDNANCLTIRLSIESDLEPQWEVICNRKEPKTISYRDRQLLSLGVVGQNCERDFIWNRFSILQRYAESKGVIKDALVSVLRSASLNADLTSLDSISDTILETGKEYGVSFTGNIQSRLMMSSSSLNSSVGLFDGDSPLMQRGKGSQRLVSMGLNISATDNGTVLLVDEIEIGLEPYRLITLIAKLRAITATGGQAIITTHSPVTVSECKVKELFVVNSSDGITTLIQLNSGDIGKSDEIQRLVRNNPEAFLSKRLIVCEGKTEIGFLRSLDNYLSISKQFRMASKGVSYCFGYGDDFYNVAKLFASCGFHVCVLMDSDNQTKMTEKKSLLDTWNVQTFAWDINNSIEEQVFADVTNEIAEELLLIPISEKGIDSIKSKLGCIHNIKWEEGINLSNLSEAERRSIGTIAKRIKEKGGWYKRIDLGEEMGDVIFKHWDEIDKKKNLKTVVNELIDWICQN